MTHNKIKCAFNKAASSYDNCCTLQLIAGKKLLSLLKKSYHSSLRIIDLGCGTGLITQELAKFFSYHHFYAIDIADKLLIKAKKHLSPFKINIHEADFDNINEQPFDIMFSNLSLHWSSNFTFTLNKLSHLLSREGVFAFSIPLAGSLPELDGFAINSFMEKSAVEEILVTAGFFIKTKVEEEILRFDSLLDALKSLKGVGANHTFHKTRKQTSHTLIKKQIKSDDKVSLTYKIGYFIVSHSPLR